MVDNGFKLKLTDILSAPINGCSRLMMDDEGAIVRTFTSSRSVDKNSIQMPRCW